MSTPTRVRLADFLLNPEIDELRLELVDGEVAAKPMPTWDHGEAAGEILVILRSYGRVSVEPRAVIEAANASPIPDVAFYRDRKQRRDGYMYNPPHVAVEVLSEGQGLPFMRRKAALYTNFGVESVWIVDLERLELHIIEGGMERTLVPGQRLTTPAVPGLDVDVSAFFPTED